jgi:hypothetical protein
MVKIKKSHVIIISFFKNPPEQSFQIVLCTKEGSNTDISKVAFKFDNFPSEKTIGVFIESSKLHTGILVIQELID